MPTPTEAPFTGKAVRLRIPVLAVDAQAEELDVDKATGRLDSPKAPTSTVAWYPAYGIPGPAGNSFWSGFNFFEGSPGPLSRLGSLRVGDEIQLLDANGGTAHYRLIKLNQYETATMPFADVLFAKGRAADAEWITVMTAGGRLAPNGQQYLDSIVAVAERVR